MPNATTYIEHTIMDENTLISPVTIETIEKHIEDMEDRCVKHLRGLQRQWGREKVKIQLGSVMCEVLAVDTANIKVRVTVPYEVAPGVKV